MKGPVIMETSNETAFEIAKQKKLHMIGETLLKTLNDAGRKSYYWRAQCKEYQVSLSNNTKHRSISKMTMDVNEQVLTEIKTSPLFYFQLDESTDVSSCSQLFVFVRYINSGDIKDEFLVCSDLKAQQKLMMS